MNSSKLRPSIVLWWGVGLAVVGALLVIFVPSLSYYLVDSSNSAGGVSNGLLSFVEILVRVLGAIVPTLGIVLIGASIVMAYLRQLLRPTLGAMVTARRQSMETE